MGQQQPLPAATSIRTRTSTRAGRRAVLQAGTQPTSSAATPTTHATSAAAGRAPLQYNKRYKPAQRVPQQQYKLPVKYKGATCLTPGYARALRHAGLLPASNTASCTKRKARAERLRRQTMCLPGKAALPCPALTETFTSHDVKCQW